MSSRDNDDVVVIKFGLVMQRRPSSLEKDKGMRLMNSEQNDEECDATKAEQRIERW